MYDDFKTANYPQAVVSPELYARHLARLVGGNVFDGFTVVPGTGLQVVLKPGNALIRYGSAAVASARLVSLVADFNLAIATADVSNPRLDLVVLYVDNGVGLPTGTPTSANLDGKGVTKAKIVTGTPASSPVAPNSTAIQASVGAGNPYLVVAQVRVNAGVSVIAGDKVTDLRAMVSGYSYKEITAPFSTTSTSNAPVTGLALAVNVPVGGADYEIKFSSPSVYNSGANYSTVRIWDGDVTTGTKLVELATYGNNGTALALSYSKKIPLAAGLHILNVSLSVSAGTGNILADSTARQTSLSVQRVVA